MISPPLEAVSWRRRRGLLLTVMIGVTVLQRFAIPGTGGIVGVGYALGVAATLLGLGRSTLRIDPSRLVLYALAVSGLLLTLLFKPASFSLSSFLMLIVMYAPFIAVMPVTVDEYERGLNVFQIIMAVLAWAGLATCLILLGFIRRWRVRDPLVATLILLAATITTRIVFFSFLSATWWMDGYERYVFPIMPLSACFFILLIYEAIAVWRRRAVPES
jgi:hypothetical protein